MNDQPRAYRLLYSPATAAVLVAASGVTLAISQARVVHDWAMLVHATWPSWSAWLVAAGYEIGVLAVGLVLVASGERRLWVAETILVAASVAASLDLSLANGAPLPRAIVAAALPVQYLAVVMAGHALTRRVAAASVPVVAVVPRARAGAHAPTCVPKGTATREAYKQRAAELAHRLGRPPTHTEVGASFGRSARTARRYLSSA